MRTFTRLLAVASLVGLPSACANSPAGPPVADDVLIVVHTTGGIAYMDWTATLDGKAGEVRCTGSCPWGGVDVRSLSEAEVEDIALAFVDAGIRHRPRSDFGICSQCADQFFHEIEYHDDTGTYRAKGDGPSLSDDLQAALNRVIFVPAVPE